MLKTLYSYTYYGERPSKNIKQITILEACYAGAITVKAIAHTLECLQMPSKTKLKREFTEGNP